jgi:hypothetical protein
VFPRVGYFGYVPYRHEQRSNKRSLQQQILVQIVNPFNNSLAVTLMSDGRNELFDKTMDEISAPDVLDSSPQHPFVFDGLEEGSDVFSNQYSI